MQNHETQRRRVNKIDEAEAQKLHHMDHGGEDEVQ